MRLFFLTAMPVNHLSAPPMHICGLAVGFLVLWELLVCLSLWTNRHMYYIHLLRAFFHY